MREIFPIHWLIDFSPTPNALFLSHRYLRYHFRPCQRVRSCLLVGNIEGHLLSGPWNIRILRHHTHTNTVSAFCWSDLYCGYNVTFYADLGLTSSTKTHMHTHTHTHTHTHSNTGTRLFLNAYENSVIIYSTSLMVTDAFKLIKSMKKHHKHHKRGLQL